VRIGRFAMVVNMANAAHHGQVVKAATGHVDVASEMTWPKDWTPHSGPELASAQPGQTRLGGPLQ
jgi:hypothetical protein